MGCSPQFFPIPSKAIADAGGPPHLLCDRRDGDRGKRPAPSKIDGFDFQIQWEADLLENLMVMDKEKEQEKIKKCIGENFKTNTGKRIAYNRFILD